MTKRPSFRATAALLTTALTAAALTGCGGSGADSKAQDNPLGLQSPGQLKLAFRSDDKPVSFIKDGKPAGFMIDLTTAMASHMHVTPSYTATDFESMVPNVRNHVYDSAAFGVLVTPAREKVTDFVKPVGFGQAQLISTRKAPIQTVESADGKTVAITRGSALIPLLQKKTPKVVIKQFPNVAASANALEAGQVDGLFTGTATTLDLLDKHKDFVSSQAITSGVNGFPVAKDKNALNKALSDAFAAVVADGTYTKLFDQWNPPGVPIPEDMLAAYPGMTQRPGAKTS